MIPMVQTVTCVAVHGETDQATAQRVLDEKSRRETVIVNGAPVPLPVDAWPKVQCDVTAVFQSPSHWQEPDRFAHQAVQVFFALEG